MPVSLFLDRSVVNAAPILSLMCLRTNDWRSVSISTLLALAARLTVFLSVSKSLMSSHTPLRLDTNVEDKLEHLAEATACHNVKWSKVLGTHLGRHTYAMTDLMCRWQDLWLKKHVNARLSCSSCSWKLAGMVYQGQCPAVWLVTEDCHAAMACCNHHGRLPIGHLGVGNATWWINNLSKLGPTCCIRRCALVSILMFSCSILGFKLSINKNILRVSLLQLLLLNQLI